MGVRLFVGNVIGVAFFVKRGQLVAPAKSTMSPRAIKVYGPSMLGVGAGQLKGDGIALGCVVGRGEGQSGDNGAPVDGVTWNPVGWVWPLKCRNFVLTSSSMARAGASHCRASLHRSGLPGRCPPAK